MLREHNHLKHNVIIVLILILSCIAWHVSTLSGLEDQGWHLLIIFIATISGVILNPLPMGAVAFMSILACVLTNTLTIEECLSGYSNHVIWLILFVFFISHGCIKTGLGARIAYHIISRLGSSTLGISYALVLVDFILAPFIPSVAARGGGILFPIAKSICDSYSDETHPGVSSRNGGFLMKVCYQSNVLTSCLFVTAMAANPLIVKLASDNGVMISWTYWAQAAIIPGIASLILMPIIIYYLHPPAMKHSDSAPKIARDKLKAMGTISSQEIIMLIIFVTLISLWILEKQLGLSATTVALGGLCAIYLFRIVSFEETVADKNAWHTFVWFATLVMISGFLTKLGLTSWVESKLTYVLIDFSPATSLLILALIYFYIHYFFASTMTHVSVFFPIFLIMFIGSKVPPQLAALILGFLSIVSACLTHYGIASGPVFFGAGYMKPRTWWYLGLTLSIVYIAIWSAIGSVWWKWLGLY